MLLFYCFYTGIQLSSLTLTGTISLNYTLIVAHYHV